MIGIALNCFFRIGSKIAVALPEAKQPLGGVKVDDFDMILSPISEAILGDQNHMKIVIAHNRCFASGGETTILKPILKK